MTKGNIRALALAGLSAGALIGAGSAAHAGAFGLRTQSATALGASFAGSASGMAGISSMFSNPATITMNPGYTSEYNFSFVAPDVNVRPVVGTPTAAFGPSGNIGQDAFVPASYSAYQVNENIWLGLASGSQFGSITKPNDVWAGQTYSRSSRVTSLSFSPILGIKFNDYLSFGIGPTLQYFKVRLNSAAAPGPTGRGVILEGDDWAAGLTTGVTITPFEGTTIGVGYKSSIHHELDGTLRVPTLTGGTVTPIKVNLNLPETVTFGITQQITPELKASLGFEWMNWSRLGTQAIQSAQLGVPVAPFPLNYRDGYLYSVGFEYQLYRDLAIRAGLGYETSPIDNSNRSTRLPDVDRLYTTVGASYNYNEKLTVSAAYAHYFAIGDSAIRIRPGDPQYNGLSFFAESRASVDVVSLSLRYRWDSPQVAEAAPIIRKF